jgi:RHS repeat-associated protein
VALALIAAASTAQAGTTSTNDPHGYPPGCPPDCSGAGGHSGGSGGAAGGTGGGVGGGAASPPPGMPVYSISPMLISLTMRDTPLSYQPAVGPAMDVMLSYNQLDIDQPASFNYSNLGPKWTFNWLGYVQDDPNAPGSSKTLVYLESGPGRLYGGYNASTGAFAPEPETGAQLVRVKDSPAIYERRFPDGSKDVFAEDDGSSRYPRRIFLTRRVDAQGNAVSLAYDDQHRLTQVTDVSGHALVFAYADTDHPFLVTGAHDSFGRSMSLDYDAAGRLAGVTDAIGMHSSFGYDGGTNITSLTTPYGSTTFASHQSGTRRWIDVTDANGNTSRMEFNQAVSGVPFSESQVPQGIHAFNRYINSRDSFFWDAQAFKEAAGNYSKAVIYHWSHKTAGGGLSSVTADSLESVKYPLENRIWYDHPGDISGGSGSLNMPSVIARVLPDGSTQITRNTYNAFGKLVRSIDPTGLQTDYTYAPNQIDVVQIERTGADGYHAVETYSYNHQHRVLSHTDETGATTRYTYNDAGQPLTETDALGGAIRYSYDASGNRTTVTDPNGHTTTYDYDALGRVTRMTDALGRATTYAYDALNRIVRTTYPDGSYEAVTWDKLDKATVRDRNGNVTTFTYDALRHRTSQTDALGGTTTWAYYPNGLLKSRTDANGHTTTWQRDLEGRITAVTDANGATSTFAYDSADRRIRSVNALGQSTAFAYDHNDRLIRTTDTNGVITDTAYTSRGWLSSRTTRARTDGTPSAADATSHFAYNARGDQTTATDADGVVTTRTYDGARRLAAVDDAFGNTHVYTRDAVGNLLAEADSAAGNTQLTRLSTYEYDAANQRVRFLDADGQVTEYSYDPNGRLSDTRDPLGNHTSSVFDSEGQLVRSTTGADADHGGHGTSVAVTSYQYDAAERLVGVTDPDGLTTRYVYDAVGQKIRQDSPDTGTTSYTYDAVGNHTGQTDARGVVTEQHVDALDRVIATHYPSDSSLDAVVHYDEPDAVTGCAGSFPVGHPTRVLDASGSTTYCYDARGNVTSVHRVIAGHPYDTTYAWTPGNRLAALRYPSGTRVTYRYDAAGRVAAVDSQGPTDAAPVPLVSTVDYLPFGPVTRMAYGTGGQALVRSYDGNYRGTGIEGLGLHLQVERDASGNVTGLREGAGHGPLTERYRYDALQRLTQTIGPYGWFNQQYSYDATGDRLTKHEAGGPPQSYSYQPGTHRLSAIGRPGLGDEHGRCGRGGQACMDGEGPVLSDAAGNIVQMPQDGQVLTLTYGASNRLMQTTTSRGLQGQYTYDANGLRAEKTTNVPGEQTRDFIYSGAHLLGEYVVGAGTSREYVWLGENVVASLDSSAHESAVHYVGTDFLGTPRTVTDDQGMQVWSWAYAGNAFGDRPAIGSYDFGLRFQGQYYDAESGLHYNVNRSYSPALGAYVKADPLGLHGGLASYGYVGANPLAFIDPLGLSRVLVLEVRKGVQQIWLTCLLTDNEPGACGTFLMYSKLKRTADASDGCEFDHYETKVENGSHSFYGLYFEWPQTTTTRYIYKAKSPCEKCSLSDFEDERETFSPPETDWEPGDMYKPYSPPEGAGEE